MDSTALANAKLPQVPAGPLPPRVRFVFGWTVAWALVGCAVAAGIVFGTAVDAGPAFRLSVLFAEVVGFVAFTSARLVFPLLERLPFSLRILLEVLTVLSGTVFGSVAILALQPLFSLAELRTVALIVLVNATIAVIVGIALSTYDSMKKQIEESYRLLREKEALERELGIAREVQRELLPRSAPDVAGLNLAGICLPAVGVGGDYYDFLRPGEETVGVVIGDVSGKGIPAALLMAGLQASVRSLCGPTPSASRLNGQLNAILEQSSSSSRYATFFLGFYDARSRTLAYSNAGHLPPLVLDDDGRVRRLEAGGLPLGMFGGVEYGEGREQLAPGTLVALFTDGVIEAAKADGEEFGERRLVELLRHHRQRPLDAIIGVVVEEVRRWQSGTVASDDVTIVLARVQ